MAVAVEKYLIFRTCVTQGLGTNEKDLIDIICFRRNQVTLTSIYAMSKILLKILNYCSNRNYFSFALLLLVLVKCM